MNFNDYQREALNTDIAAKKTNDELLIPLLGLAGEVGELLSEYKKHLWAGEGYKLWKERVSEELGDLLWYISSTASKFDLKLENIAEENLRKCRDRWAQPIQHGQMGFQVPNSFDDGYPENERLPRHMIAEIVEVAGSGTPRIRLSINGEVAGDPLTDNAYSKDGYRFHDVFHLTYAAVLGWSPVTRSNLERKRKSKPLVDEVEDGGRAIVIEEGVSALVFSYAARHSFLENVHHLDYELLRTIKFMTTGLEVSRCPMADWEKAIFVGYEIWRTVEANKGGILEVDLDAQTVRLRNPSSHVSPGTAQFNNQC